MFWAATTIYLKKFVRERPITHFQTLFAQLFFSIPLLAAAYLILEWNRPVMITLPVLSAFAYQMLLVAFFSYLLWFWMIHHYPVSRLAAFTFLAPLFGVIFSGVLLGEPLTVMLLAGLMLVAVGIYLVNRPEKAVSEDDGTAYPLRRAAVVPTAPDCTCRDIRGEALSSCRFWVDGKKERTCCAARKSSTCERLSGLRCAVLRAGGDTRKGNSRERVPHRLAQG